MITKEKYFKFNAAFGGKIYFSSNDESREMFLDGNGSLSLAVSRLKDTIVKLLQASSEEWVKDTSPSLLSWSELLPKEDFHLVFDKCRGVLRCRYYSRDDHTRARQLGILTEPLVTHFWLYYLNFLRTEFGVRLDDPMEPDLRYNVGERRVFIAYQLEGMTGEQHVQFAPWEHTLNSMDLKTLVCTEHHWVPSEWDEDPKYHGFFFQEEGEGSVWFNQYPVAVHTPNSDHLDYHVRLNTDAPGAVTRVYEDVTHTINRIIRGIRQFHQTSMKFDIDPQTKTRLEDYEQALKEHLEDLVLFVQSQTGGVIKIEALKVQYQDGRIETLPDVPAARLIWPDSEEPTEEPPV